jgi:acyl-[acyl carrier protein]--UDP-N-acetylglucosamine O-acyltransferase
MSISTEPVRITPPPDAPEASYQLNSTGPDGQERIRYYARSEPIYGSFKLYKRDGEYCFKHTNGGGLVALSARVQHGVFVAEGAAVLGDSIVRGDVRLEDQAVIEGNARVSGRVKLRHQSKVSGNAVIEGQVSMHRHAHVGENAHLRGMISLDYYAFVGDESRLFGTMHLE